MPQATPTPLLTPAIRQPAAEPAGTSAAPPPENGEQILTIAGDRIPAAPMETIPATAADGRSLALRIENASVQAWGGLFGRPDAGWVDAPGELLWPGAQVYATGAQRAPQGADAEDAASFQAETVRIINAPQATRSVVLAYPPLANAVANDAALALLGSDEEQGVYLLDNSGTVQQLWGLENDAAWVSDDGTAGMLIRAPDLPAGLNTFSWVRDDGTGIQIFAQPFHRLSGVAGDSFGGLWWIETPQANLDVWQLWRYDARSARVLLVLQAAGDRFRTGSRIVSPTLSPVLLLAQPSQPGASGEVSLLLDTRDYNSQAQYTGLFRLTLALDADGRGHTGDAPQLLLPPGEYRGPLALSPDQSRLALPVYDAAHPSLTAGESRPENTIRLLTLAGRGANTMRPVYAAQSPFEFLAAQLAWQDNERLLAARSRFAPNGIADLDRFALVVVQIAGPAGSAGQSAAPLVAGSYQLPEQRSLKDFAPCRNRPNALLIVQDANGNLELHRWDGASGGNPPQPLFGLPANFTRVFLCWQA
jgi:hypothetical protein